MEGYDFVIVGAGSAGCVLANRLSADPAVRVCLIEAGSKDNSLLVRMPAGVGNLIKEPNTYNWGFYTEPQRHMDGRKLYWPRGKGWGGSSSINGMIYIRGHAGDYDHWAQMGLRGWSYADVLPYFRKSEAYEAGETAFHGGSGPLRVSESPLSSPVYKAFIEAGRDAGYPVTDDFNAARQEGFGPYQRTIHNGERWSASYGYLRPIAGKRPNLTILSGVCVSRIIIEKGRATGVEVAEGRGRPARRLSADNEVLVCAGAVQSPQILMLSGIGNPDPLKAIGISVTSALRGVGDNLQDHLDVTVIHEMTQPLSAYSAQKGLKRLAVGVRYLVNQSGPGADNFLQAGAFLNSRSGLSMPDLQLHFVNAIMRDHGAHKPDRDGYTVHACQLRPESRGTVSLASADPFDPPLIDPNYLSTEEDRRALRQAVKMVRDVCRQNVLRPFTGPEIMPGESVKTDQDIDAFIRRTGETIYHPVGSVAMGADEASPLTPDLKVRGIDGLRVVDASVMPTLIGGNTNAPTIMIAEKAADLILGRPALAREEPQTEAALG